MSTRESSYLLLVSSRCKIARMLANRLPKSVPGTRRGARLVASKQEPKSVPGTRCGARSDASKTQPGGPSNRCQALGAAPGRMLANRLPKSVPGTRCDARPDASKTQPGGPSNRYQAPGVAPRSDASKTGGPKSAPGTNGTVVL